MTALFKDRALIDAAVEILRVYAQPQRLMILSCLLEGERTVSEIDAATGVGQPALSQQLAELRRKELVRTRRQGTQIFYELADERVDLCIRCVEAMLDGQDGLKERLREVVAPEAAPAGPAAPAGAASFARVLAR